MFTVSPNRQYLGLTFPTTPATTGPVCRPQRIFIGCFFPSFAVIVTASVQLVGVYVVFASLILPALAVNTLVNRCPFFATLCSGVAIILGIVAATMADMPAGPMLVFAYATMAIAFRLVARYMPPNTHGAPR